MAAAAPVPSLEAGDPSLGKVSFKETTEMIEATWGPGATNPNNVELAITSDRPSSRLSAAAKT